MVSTTDTGCTCRRGHAIQGVLIGIAVAGAFVLAAVIVQPNLLQGGLLRPSPDLMPVSADRREALDHLAALIASSAEVLAVHQRGPAGGGSPFVEIVLRLHDGSGSTFISRNEIAVISHSRVLQTIMFYGRGDSDDDLLLTRAEVTAPEFCSRWRLDPAVQPRIIGAGVSDLRAQILHDRSGEPSSLRLALTWPGESPDEFEEEAVVLVEVRSRNAQ